MARRQDFSLGHYRKIDWRLSAITTGLDRKSHHSHAACSAGPAKDRGSDYFDIAYSVRTELEKIEGFISVECFFEPN